jgi:hypothetical protein
VSDPEVPESEPTPTEEDGEMLCKLVLERLPYDLGVIDEGAAPRGGAARRVLLERDGRFLP